MTGHGDSRVRFFVAYGYSLSSALLVLGTSFLAFNFTWGEMALAGPVGFVIALIASLVPAFLARFLPGPIWLTPVALGLGAGLLMYPLVGFTLQVLGVIA